MSKQNYIREWKPVVVHTTVHAREHLTTNEINMAVQRAVDMTAEMDWRPGKTLELGFQKHGLLFTVALDWRKDDNSNQAFVGLESDITGAFRKTTQETPNIANIEPLKISEKGELLNDEQQAIPDGSHKHGDQQKYYWLACNGASCAASGLLPLPKSLQVSPTPETLIGYKTRKEQLSRQKFFLESPIKKVQQYVNRLPGMAKRGEIALIIPPNPEPPTRGQTFWMASPINSQEVTQ